MKGKEGYDGEKAEVLIKLKFLFFISFLSSAVDFAVKP